MKRTTRPPGATVEAFHADLAASFAARRCDCGAQATVVLVGTEEVREMGIMLRRAVSDRNLCSTHAG